MMQTTTSKQSNIVKSTEIEKQIHVFDGSILDDANSIIEKLKNVADDDKNTISKFVDDWYLLTIKKINHKIAYAKGIINTFSSTKTAKHKLCDASVNQDEFEEYVESCGLAEVYNRIVNTYEEICDMQANAPAQPIITLQTTVEDKIKAEHDFKLKYAKYNVEKNRKRNICYAAIQELKSKITELDRSKELVKNAKKQVKQLNEARDKCDDLRDTLKLHSLIESEELIEQLKALTTTNHIANMVAMKNKQ